MALTIRKTRRVFDIELLTSSALRDGATLKNIPEKFNSGTMIDFACNCGCDCCKRFDSAVDFGFFCTSCRQEQTVQRAKETKLGNEMAEVIISDKFKLVLSGLVEEVMDGNDTLTLTLAPFYRKASLYFATARSAYIVKWWDLEAGTARQKAFSAKKISKETAHELALKYTESHTIVSDDYRLKVKVSLVYDKLAHYQQHYKISAEVKQYQYQQVPLDPWMLGTWLGDGTARAAAISNIDIEVVAEWRRWAEDNKLKFVTDDNVTWKMSSGITGAGTNKFITLLRKLGVFMNKP